MNVRKGFHRIGVILWVFYAICALWYPVHEDLKHRQEAYALTGAVYQSCTQTQDHSKCWEQYEEGMAKDKELYPIGGVYTESVWHLLWFVPLLLFVPPAIVYGIGWFIAKIGLWVIRGFRPSVTPASQ